MEMKITVSKVERDSTKIKSSHLLVYFVEHCWVVVFFWVVVEADHAVLLVNTGINLTIFNLHGRNMRKKLGRWTEL